MHWEDWLHSVSSLQVTFSLEKTNWQFEELQHGPSDLLLENMQSELVNFDQFQELLKTIKHSPHLLIEDELATIQLCMNLI